MSLHSGLRADNGVGLVRSPVSTTALQVASRVVLVWGICEQFPSVPANSIAYSTMLIAWSATEVVRYSYFVFALNGAVPGVLTWLRYNMFFILYPLGISSEMALVYLSIPEAKKRDPMLEYVMYGILAIYFPGTSPFSLIYLPILIWWDANISQEHMFYTLT